MILGLGSLNSLSLATPSLGVQAPQTTAQMAQVQYTTIRPDGSTMVSTRLFSGKQVRGNGTATRPITLEMTLIPEYLLLAMQLQ